MLEILIEDHFLRWPPALLIEELDKLINYNLPNWGNFAETLLDDAFEDGSMFELFESITSRVQFSEVGKPWENNGKESTESLQVSLLREVKSLSHEFPQSSQLPILFTFRNTATPIESTDPSFEALLNELNATLQNLRNRGYFEKVFGPDCIDREEEGVSFDDINMKHSGSGLTWPLDIRYYDAFGRDFLYNALEIFDYYVAAPTQRSWHGFGEPHWDFYRFSRRRGRAVYRWEINRILSKHKSRYEMATEGANAGQIVERTAPQMADLITSVTTETRDNDDAQKVSHAFDHFQKREIDSESKRSACITLAAVLENRRYLLKENLLTKDEGALFQLANEFHIRHNNERQKRDYDSAFLEWVFWWYIATIDLSNKLIKQQEVVIEANQSEDSGTEPPF